jgi:hypothetical protein
MQVKQKVQIDYSSGGKPLGKGTVLGAVLFRSRLRYYSFSLAAFSFRRCSGMQSPLQSRRCE